MGSLAVAPKKGAPPNIVDQFGNALQRFTREDPTLRVHVDNESKQTIISGMGELHLDVYVEPSDEDDFEFVNECVGTNVPSEFIPSVEKGCRDAIAKGDLVGFPVEGLRVVLQDGAAHAVDSSDQAFRAAALYAVKKAIGEAGAKVLEPVMALEVSAPTEFQGDIMGSINQRRGMITNNSTDGAQSVINADVPLAQLFGYSTDIRSQ